MAAALGRPDAGGIVLAGPAGVGKTRLAKECQRLAEDAGFVTARAVASRSAATIPLGALAHLLLPVDVSTDRIDQLQWARSSIEGLAAEQPLILVVDDAHLLDDASATLLHQLSLDERVFLVVTLRTGEPVPDPVVALWKDGPAERIDLPPLARSAVDALVAAVLGRAVDGAVLRDFWRASQGNALLLRELVLGTLADGTLTDVGGIWRLRGRLGDSPRLVELVEARLAVVDADGRRALELLALGEPIGLPVLEELAGERVLAALDQRGLLLIEQDGRRAEVRLSHPLHGDVVRSQLSALATRSGLRRLADAVESVGARRRQDVLRVATWRLDGGGTSPTDLLVAAAHQAHFAFDDVLAERLARAALAAGGGSSAGRMLGEALSAQGRHLEAEDALASIDVSTASDQERAFIAMARAIGLFWGLRRDGDAVAVLREAEAATFERRWRDEMAGLRATFDLLAGRPGDAVEAVSAMLADTDDRVVAQAAIAAGPALAVLGRCEEAVVVADRGLSAHLRLGEQSLLSYPGIHVVTRTMALLEAGRLADAELTARSGYDAAVTAGVRDGQAWFALMQGRVALFQGLLATATRWFREGAVIFDEAGEDGTRRWCLGGIVLARAMAADADGARAALASLDDVAPNPTRMMEPDLERARAWERLVEGRTAEAVSILNRAAALAEATGALALEGGALHDLARIGHAAAVVDRLAAVATAVDGELTKARAAHAAALARADAPALHAAGESFEAIGALLYAAEAHAAAAAVHRRRGERRRAEASAQRAAALAARCEGARTPALGEASTAQLTRREREIATLAAQGLSSRAIAERLAVSVRTVENHLQRVYEKLGLTSRAELVAALARRE